MKTIAIIEDDEDQSFILTQWLSSYGYRTTCFCNAELFLASEDWQYRFALILLDWHLPGLSGITLLNRLNASQTPVIFITAKNKDEQLAEALHAGADDFLIKPVSKTVLLARIHAVIRRTDHKLQPVKLEKNRLTVFGHQINLSRNESALLQLLLDAHEACVSRETLIAGIWQDDKFHERSLDVLISRIRKKLAIFAEKGLEITSQYGKGYSLKFSSLPEET